MTEHMIHWIVPTRNRPRKIELQFEAWQELQDGASSIEYIVDADDPQADAYRKLEAKGLPIVWNTDPELRFIGPILNRRVAQLMSLDDVPFAIGFMGDDHMPRTMGFDDKMLTALEELGTGIVYGDDLLQHERIPTEAAVTTDIVKAVGYFVPVTLHHLCLDTYWLRLGQIIDRIRYLPDVIIEHIHPAAGKVPNDEDYARVNSGEMISHDGAAWRDYLVDQLWEDAMKVKAIL